MLLVTSCTLKLKTWCSIQMSWKSLQWQEISGRSEIKQLTRNLIMVLHFFTGSFLILGYWGLGMRNKPGKNWAHIYVPHWVVLHHIRPVLTIYLRIQHDVIDREHCRIHLRRSPKTAKQNANDRFTWFSCRMSDPQNAKIISPHTGCSGSYSLHTYSASHSKNWNKNT